MILTSRNKKREREEQWFYNFRQQNRSTTLLKMQEKGKLTD